MFFAHQDYPTITLESLKGFEEDLNAAKVFERRFQPEILGGIAIVFLGFTVFGLLAVRAQYKGDASALETYCSLTFSSFLFGFALCMAGSRRMSDSIPISPRSGKEMQAFRLEDTIKEGKFEVVYVCPASHTYFRRIYSEQGG